MPYAVNSPTRAAWDQFKTAAHAAGPNEAEGVVRVALGAWAQSDAGTKTGAVAAEREAILASIVGACAVDRMIEKFASAGQLLAPEAEYLYDLNAEAGLRDLRRLTKNASALEAVLDFVKRHPAAVGAGLGTVAGGAFGAYADGEDRLRGAMRYAVPGAVAGGLLGQGITDYRSDVASKALDETRKAELHRAALKGAKPRR